ncbi:MAG TPA: MarR family winged helix-turn-helix transcriptional regulator [Polyangia bacterium]
MTKAEQFAALVSDVAREVVRRRSSDACCGDLTLEQYEALRAVSRDERSTIGSLSKALGVDISTMSRNVSVLERNGYLARVRSEDDGRIVRVSLTSGGRRALETLRCGERDVLGDVYDRLPPSDRAAVMTALQALRACLLQEGGAATSCCSPVTVRRRTS